MVKVGIAERAGIKQPALYAHFKNVDDALGTAATEVCDILRVFFGTFQATVIYQRVPAEVIAQGLAKMFEVAMTQRPFAELFIRHRLDRGPLGEQLRAVMAEARADLTANLMGHATSTGVRGK